MDRTGNDMKDEGKVWNLKGFNKLWVTEWVSEKVTTREAIASKNM